MKLKIILITSLLCLPDALLFGMNPKKKKEDKKAQVVATQAELEKRALAWMELSQNEAFQKAHSEELKKIQATHLEKIAQKGISLSKHEMDKKALPLLEQAYNESIEQNNPYIRAFMAATIGDVYNKRNEFDKAESYIKEAYSLGKHHKYHDIHASTANALSLKALIDKKSEEALAYLDETNDILKGNPDIKGKENLQKDLRTYYQEALKYIATEGEDAYHADNYPEAVKKLTIAYNKSLNVPEIHATSAILLGEIYESGPREIKDDKKALEYYTKGYKLSKNLPAIHATAALRLGHLFISEQDTGSLSQKQDNLKGVAYLNESINSDITRNNFKVLFNLGSIYTRGIPGIPKDPKKARDLYAKAKIKAQEFHDIELLARILLNEGGLDLDEDNNVQQALSRYYEAYPLTQDTNIREMILYNLYEVQISLLHHVHQLIKKFKSEPSLDTIKEAYSLLKTAGSIKYIDNLLADGIQKEYAELQALEAPLLKQKMGPAPLPTPEKISPRAQEALDEAEICRNEKEFENLLQRFDAALDAYTKQQTVGKAQFEEAKKILLEASLLASKKSDVKENLRKKYAELSHEHVKKQSRVQELIAASYAQTAKHTHQECISAQKNLAQAQRLAGDDTELQNAITEAQQHLQEAIDRAAQMAQEEVDTEEEPLAEEEKKVYD